VKETAMNESISQAVSLTNLAYSIGSKEILKGITLDLKAGSTLGLLGLNGAGKTSLIQIILGLSNPKSGTALIFGIPTVHRRCFGRVGYAPEEPSFPDFLTVGEYLGFVAAVRIKQKSLRKEAIANELAEFELESKKRVKDLSKGMRRKLSLAQAFIGNPELMILDEPLTGLDPLAIIKLREIILRAKVRNVSFLVSSHILSEIEKICDDVAIIKQGQLELFASMSSLVAQGKNIEGVFTEIHRASA
jgi:ABC-2 type transport system ATP-binding protein